jgi:hypothetical protein
VSAASTGEHATAICAAPPAARARTPSASAARTGRRAPRPAMHRRA